VADAAHVANDVLRGIADDSRGFMLFTGALNQDDEFLLSGSIPVCISAGNGQS
jgi:hypothetical protein